MREEEEKELSKLYEIIERFHKKFEYRIKRETKPFQKKKMFIL